MIDLPLLNFTSLSYAIKGIGIDIAKISRITQLISRYDQETLTLLFTLKEIEQCQLSSHPHKYYAVCFAVKESVGKALGTGLVDIDWNEIEAEVSDVSLKINLFGKANLLASKLGIQQWLAIWCDWGPTNQPSLAKFLDGNSSTNSTTSRFFTTSYYTVKEMNNSRQAFVEQLATLKSEQIVYKG